LRVAVLGPQGSYSEKAARKCRPESELLYLGDFEEVMQAVEEGRAEEGVLPLENSLEGSVGVNMDLLLRSSAQMVGEVNVQVRHCLLSLGDSSNIKVILSHPQGLAQCRKYLRTHYPQAELRATGSTSHAARLAQEFPEMAAVAGSGAAERYGLKILARDIQDGQENVTRFAVVGLYSPPPTGCDKTSLVVYLDRDRPGALYAILKEFARRNINLTRIESRPSRLTLGDYYFYIDLVGHARDPVVKEALNGVERASAMVKVLGAYPRASP